MKSNKLFKIKYLLLLTISSGLSAGCEELLEIETPRTETVRETVFSTDETANAAMDGVYVTFIGPGPSFLMGGGLEITTGLVSDELINYSSTQRNIEYANNDIQPDNTNVFSVFWRQPYEVIYNVNGIIEGVTNNNQINFELRNHLRGEALFIRALMHFYLVNFFGSVPYSESTAIETNNSLSREQPSAIYEKITRDLIEAYELMFEDYVISEGVRVRANRYAAAALLARVYLYIEEWSNAEEFASIVIDQNGLYTLETLDNTFLATSLEAILQLASINFRRNENISPLGDVFVITRSPGFGLTGFTSINPGFLAVFDTNDARLNNWIGEYTSGTDTWLFPNKYKNHLANEVVAPENTVILRLAEQYLIRAEARARLNNIPESIEDIDNIRGRAGLTLLADSIPEISQTDLLVMIGKERQKELFAEGGHRWFDLKRTGQADQVLAPVKEGWQPTDVLFPIPESELEKNANLLPQNEGY